MIVLWAIAIAATFMLCWIYGGYGVFLQMLCALPRLCRPPLSPPADHDWPAVTVLLTVHNEARVIQQRIQNLLALDYPADRLQIVVASDGSTDATCSLVRSFADPRIRLLEYAGLGKTAAQNAAMSEIHTEIVAFTDADILFSPGWLKQVVQHFQDPEVGAVDGRLCYGRPAVAQVQASQGRYWLYEMKLRRLESRLGILAVLSGAGFALRRAAFVPMDPAIGEDCIIPLDVVCQGLLVVHDSDAVHFDEFETDTGVTMRRRVRMTLRNWQGTWRRSQLLNPCRHPGYAFALWSHKILRWLSPVFLLAATISSAGLLVLQITIPRLLLATPWTALFLAAAFHLLFERRRRLLPGTGAAYSFVLANMAFIIGVSKALAGWQIRAYRNT
jgi:cellulose synthase/poly-beta-1,6-N-acetylglucosamine synthase-like glycosyltransferase